MAQGQPFNPVGGTGEQRDSDDLLVGALGLMRVNVPPISIESLGIDRLIQRMQNIENEIELVRRKIREIVYYYETFGRDLEDDPRLALYKACVDVVESLENITNTRETTSPYFYTKRLVQQRWR
jgi:hypothetical protein